MHGRDFIGVSDRGVRKVQLVVWSLPWSWKS
jgi:hypothetical protein